MQSSKAKDALPPGVRAALAKLGSDLSRARRRRRLTIGLVAERAFVGRNTITRLERGDPGVSIGIYATVLFIYGMTDRLADLVDARFDAIGLGLEAENLPKRIRSR
jgi:transcriptional regulator with XRE-family HTH domain